MAMDHLKKLPTPRLPPPRPAKKLVILHSCGCSVGAEHYAQQPCPKCRAEAKAKKPKGVAFFSWPSGTITDVWQGDGEVRVRRVGEYGGRRFEFLATGRSETHALQETRRMFEEWQAA